MESPTQAGSPHAPGRTLLTTAPGHTPPPPFPCALGPLSADPFPGALMGVPGHAVTHTSLQTARHCPQVAGTWCDGLRKTPKRTASWAGDAVHSDLPPAADPPVHRVCTDGVRDRDPAPLVRRLSRTPDVAVFAGGDTKEATAADGLQQGSQREALTHVMGTLIKAGGDPRDLAQTKGHER